MTNDSPTALEYLLNHQANLTSDENIRSNWKRRAKTVFDGFTLRVFTNTITHKFVSVIYDAVRNQYFIHGVINKERGLDIKKTLLHALKEVKHCGDYGDLYFLANPPTAWVVMGDADGCTEDGYTSFDEIREKLLATGLVNHVQITGETFPDGIDEETSSEFTYVDFGRFGITV